MADVNGLLAAYGDDHRDPRNRRLHSLCVPLIVLSLVALLWALPRPAALAAAGDWLNWGTLALGLLTAGYLVVAPRLGLGALLVSPLLALATAGLDRLPWPLWLVALGLFLLGWAGQFLGHHYEGRRPSFLRDLRFLLVGPLWVLAGLYRTLGIRH